MGFGKQAFMCSQNSHGEGLHPCSLAALLQQSRREHLPGILFLQEIRHNIYQGNIQKSSRSEREDPGYCFPCTNTESFCSYWDKAMGENKEGKEDTHMGMIGPTLLFLQWSQGVLPAPFGDWAHIAKQAPRIPPRAVESCILAALQRSKPARSRIAKSPT